MAIQRDFINIEVHKRVDSSGAPSNLFRVIGCNHKAVRRTKRNEYYRNSLQRSKIKSMKAYLYISKLK